MDKNCLTLFQIITMKKFFFLYFLFALLITSFSTRAQTLGDYRSVTSGIWSSLITWETYNGTSWVGATVVPTSTNGVISILNTHTVIITSNVSIDQVVINTGGMINWTLGTCIFVNGAGVDLLINGTFWDNRGAVTPSIVFTASTWAMGTNGTLIRSAGNSSNNWQGAYDLGISNIPATANWILRKTGAQTPVLSSTTPGTGSVYPNLIIENTTATAWALGFTGTAASQIIKGDLDIGGTASGTGVITFNNTNTNSTPTLIQNSLYVRNVGAAHIYNNSGTGTTIQRYLSVDGDLTYTGITGSFSFTGANFQIIGGTGNLQIRNLTINKSGNIVTLNSPITINNLLTLTQGRIISTTTNLITINTNGSVTVTSPTTNSSFVSGPIRKDNTSAGFSFPVGKGTNYQPLTVSPTSGGSFGTFWTEDFNNGCTLLCIAHTYSGLNGPWTLTDATPATDCSLPVTANQWYVSCAENGNAIGTCGTTCGAGANATLHLGNISISPSASAFCPTGDCGAAYDAGGFCGQFGGGFGGTSTITDKRIESPVINCTGKNNISIGFKYMEGGTTTLDNAILWYFDGVSWAVLDDMPKSSLGACAASQGQWVAYTFNLPASANNNSNVKIGFRWVNDDVGTGATDPSFAVDDITLSDAPPPESFTCEYFSANPILTFGTAKDATIADITPVEYWILDRVAGSANKLVTLGWDNASAISTPASSQIIRWDGAQWKDLTNGGTTGVASTDPSCTTQAVCGTMVAGIICTSFSPFTFGIPIVPLPIELLNFTAQLVQTRGHLQWATATEKNVNYFSVEKSMDGVSFKEFDRVSTSGNSTSIKNYQVYDNNLQEGITYYRLKIIDSDASFEYSKIVAIEYNNAEQGISLFPNPTKSKLYLSVTGVLQQVKQLRVIDVTGVELKSDIILFDNNTYEISLDNLSDGVYFIEFMYKDKKRTEKIIKL